MFSFVLWSKPHFCECIYVCLKMCENLLHIFRQCVRVKEDKHPVLGIIVSMWEWLIVQLKKRQWKSICDMRYLKVKWFKNTLLWILFFCRYYFLSSQNVEVSRVALQITGSVVSPFLLSVVWARLLRSFQKIRCRESVRAAHCL